MDDYVTQKEFKNFVDNHFNTFCKKVDSFIISTKVNMKWLTAIGLAIFITLLGVIVTKIL
jgi:hypothetical protein